MLGIQADIVPERSRILRVKRQWSTEGGEGLAVRTMGMHDGVDVRTRSVNGRMYDEPSRVDEAFRALRTVEDDAVVRDAQEGARGHS